MLAVQWIRQDVDNLIISKYSFPFYGIIILCSIISSLVYIYLNLKKENINNKNVFLYILMYISFAIVFGKLYTVITDPNQSNIFTAGLSSYGGLIGVVISSIIFEKILPTDNKIIKYTIISLPLTYGISKIGCFIAGCCYGIPYDGILSVTYVDGLNIKLFPIQFLEVVVFLIIFMICNKLKDKKNIIYITLFLVSIFKFLLDFLRYDHIKKLITVNQIFSLILLIVVIIILVYKKFKNQLNS